jgi:RNA polymerase sigma-70 factor (ECF subfamily)
MADDSQASGEKLRLHLLVLRCQTGDERAFAQLFEALAPRTLRYLQGLVGDDADDVQQEVWLAVYRGIASVENAGAFRTWLFRATRHRAMDFLRRRKREREVFADPDPEFPEPAVSAGADGALDSLISDEVLARLATAHREVLMLRYRDDMSYAEIAMVTGCPIGTVRTRLHHARRKLQHLLQGGLG